MNRISRKRVVLLACRLVFGLIPVTLGSSLALRAEPANEVRFKGESHPEPPFQHAPWIPPTGEGTPELTALIETTRQLFENGMSDPRGCEYRRIKILVGDVQSEKPTEIATRGWVLPEEKATDGASSSGATQSASTHAQAATRFAICWNGLVYPVLSVAERWDINRDIRTMLANLRKFQPGRGLAPAEWSSWFHAEAASVSADVITSIKCPLLLRLGMARPARQLWDAMDDRRFQIPGLEPIPGAPGAVPSSERDRLGHDSSVCTTIIAEWVFASSERALCAFMRRDDQLARLCAKKISDGLPGLTKHFENPISPSDSAPIELGSLRFLSHFRAFVAELDRRSNEKHEVRDAAANSEKAKRIQKLILNLEEIGMNSNGEQGPLRAGILNEYCPSVRSLIDEGEDAVEPLLDCLESDVRLTRSTQSVFSRSSYDDKYRKMVGVDRPAYLALAAILRSLSPHYNLETDDLKGRAALASDIRKFWDANKGIPMAERWFRILADDSAKPEDWVRAAVHIVGSIEEIPVRDRFQEHFHEVRSVKSSDFAGVAKLCAKADPSVADLLRRRMMGLVTKAEDRSATNPNLWAAESFADALIDWNGKAEAGAVHDFYKVLFELNRKDSDQGSSRWLVPKLRELATDLIALGDSSMADEYAQWLREMLPKIQMEADTRETLLWFEPLWRNPGSAVVQAAVSQLFKDEHPESQNAMKKWLTRGNGRPLLSSPLLGLRGFREWLISGLDDQTPIGTSGYNQAQKSWQVVVDGDSEIPVTVVNSDPEDSLSLHPPPRTSFRVCDLCAWQLGEASPMPVLAFYWSEKKRDATIAKCKEILRQYGDRYQFSAANWGTYIVDRKLRASMSFQEFKRPATEDDVRAGNAIFSLPPAVGAKCWPMREFPMKAQLKPTSKLSPYLADEGFVWQAEEGVIGGRRQLFFGFCANGCLTRVPAEELEFPAALEWKKIADGLSCKFECERGPHFLIPGVNAPLILTLSFRNLDAIHPLDLKTLFPSFGKLRAFRQMMTTKGKYFLGPELPHKRSTEIDMPALRQILDPLTETQIVKIPLQDFYSFTGPGAYHLKMTFGAAKQHSEWKPIWASLDVE